MLHTVVKTGQVLELFDRQRPEWGVTEIAKALNLPKSNAHDIVSTLESINLLQRTGRARYRLGWRLMSLANGVVLGDSLQRYAPEVMGQLSDETGQTTHLAVWDGERLMFLARTLGRRGLDQPHARSGSRLLAHCTASGKVLLADLPWSEVSKRIGADELDSVVRTSRSLRNAARLSAELEQVRKAGIGFNLEETDLGVAAMAVPVRNSDGQVVAALGVTVAIEDFPTFRRRYEALIKRMGCTLGRRLDEQDAQGPSIAGSDSQLRIAVAAGWTAADLRRRCSTRDLVRLVPETKRVR